LRGRKRVATGVWVTGREWSQWNWALTMRKTRRVLDEWCEGVPQFHPGLIDTVYGNTPSFPPRLNMRLSDGREEYGLRYALLKHQ
jgi:hypothetical protein